MAGNKRPVGVNFEKILQSLQGDVQEMKTEYEDGCLPINDDNKHLHQFCERLEFVFNFNMIEGSSFLSGRKDLWQYFCKCLANRRNIHDGLKIVKANTELKTSIGRFRCFIRYCLVHQCLGDVAQQCVDNKSVTRQFYQEGALTLNSQLLPTLLSCLYQLCDIPFDLPPSGHDLDVSWPTFTRLGAAGGWRAPSRTMSLSSLYSHVSQLSEAVGVQSPNSPTMARVGEDDPLNILDSALAVQETGLEVADLHQQLSSLQEDNAMLRESCSSLQSQLDQAKNANTVVPSTSMGEDSQIMSSVHDKCHKCELLTEELKITKSQNEDLEGLRCQLEEQIVVLQLQQDQFETQEKDLNSEIICLQGKLNQAHITSRTFDSCVPSVTKTDTVSDLPLVTIVPEQTQVPDSDESESHVTTDTTASAQETLEQCQSRLRELEKENQLLQEQCNAAEVEKTMLRTNIRKISEAEEKLRQKVASLDEQEHEYESLQEEVDSLKEQLEERGQLLHIASSRVTELEAALKTNKTSSEEALNHLKQAEDQASELQSTHNKLNQEHEELKKEIETLHVQLADLRFQMSSKDMECDAAIKADQEKMKALTTAALQINEKEARITHLEQQAAAEKELWLSEASKLSSMMTKLQEDIQEKVILYSSLNQQLNQTETKLEMTQKNLTETQNELKTTQDNSSQLSSDNEQLREKILQLLREKDTLWQANMRLEAAAGGNRTWMDNSCAQKCLGCSVSFSLTRRRHHCRTCGRIFCTGCSDNWIMTPASSKRVRVCDDCFSVQAELAAIVATVANTTSSSWHGNDENADQSATAQASINARPMPISTRQPNDDDYAVISDDEVQSSRLSSSPSSSSPPSNPEVVPEVRATTDILTFSSLSSQPPTDFETWVGAGTRSLVPVELPAGVTLQWNFISEPKCVSFSVLHQPPSPNSQEGGEETPSVNQRVLIPTTRVASTQGSTVRGRLITKQAGVYTLVFDNASSRYTAKKITYSLRLLKQAGEDSLSQHASPSPICLPSP